jgi:predicted transcriptional regulator
MSNVIQFPIKEKFIVRAECMIPWSNGGYEEEKFTDIEEAKKFFSLMAAGYDVVEMYDANMNVIVKTSHEDMFKMSEEQCNTRWDFIEQELSKLA